MSKVLTSECTVGYCLIRNWIAWTLESIRAHMHTRFNFLIWIQEARKHLLFWRRKKSWFLWFIHFLKLFFLCFMSLFKPLLGCIQLKTSEFHFVIECQLYWFAVVGGAGVCVGAGLGYRVPLRGGRRSRLLEGSKLRFPHRQGHPSQMVSHISIASTDRTKS